MRGRLQFNGCTDLRPSQYRAIEVTECHHLQVMNTLITGSNNKHLMTNERKLHSAYFHKAR